MRFKHDNYQLPAPAKIAERRDETVVEKKRKQTVR